MINVAQIGVGYWGPNLLRNLVYNKDCEVSLVVDLSKERREYVKNTYPAIEISDNIDSILKNKNIDAVVIATPVFTHYEIIIKCLNAGKHILVEKPMASKASQVKEIKELADKKKLVAMVGHTFLFNSAVKYIKELIDKNEIGDIRYIYCQRLNLGRIRNDVDALWNLAPHDVSIIQYWLNDPLPDKISRNGSSFVQEGIDDVVFLNIKYPNNIYANIHVSWLDPNKKRKITIVGSKKMIVYDDIADDKVTIFDKGIDKMAILGKGMDFDELGSFKFHHRSGDILKPKIDWSEPLAVEVAHFLDCILNDIPCITDANHALKVVDILEKGS